ncbi:MAG: hypothetical protein HUK23_03100 [Sphaerochaetaceae bacterium]|nr:hypothetical protein [Sphaerochaetaceae bacterium]
MKESRRYHCLFILVMIASVFLCLTSCGIPTYLIPKESISASTSTEANIINATFKYESDSISPSQDRVGVLLLYRLSEVKKEYSDKYISQFKSNFLISDYDGTAISITDEPILIYKDSDNEYPLYSFKIDNKNISAPDYHFLIKENPSTMQVSFNYDKESKVINLSELHSYITPVTLQLYQDFDLPSDKYLDIYAAISVQSKNYSNLYWSKLYYIGSVQSDN